MIKLFEYGLLIVKEHINKGIDSYLGDQEVISLELKKYNNISKGLYNLPYYTVGIPPERNIKKLCIVHPIHCDKIFSLKERLLYYIDENHYYSSPNNKYIIFARDYLYRNITIVKRICEKFNLILILPDQLCIMPNCIYKMKDSFGDSAAIKMLNKNNVTIRESISFYENILVL